MRLIDADYLIYAIEHELWDWGTVDGITATTVLKQTISDIKQTPTADAVPVIRCKDCRHWRRNPINESSEWGLCFKHKDVAVATDRTDWCSWAEGRTDEIN